MLLILLSNRLGRLSSKVESRIGKNRIEFKAYTADQLERILNQSKNSEKENSTNLVNKFVAKKVAGGTGDIRKARDLLEDGAPDIQGMNKKIKEYYEPLIVRYHRLLNKYQKMVIRVINMSESNKMDGVGLYNDVKRECKINSIEILPHYDYCDVIEDLRDMGFIKIRNREVTRDYLVEELE
ncbi:hypothetical protein ECANGB1_2292 [Enterospora canceri]|uniref:Cdc6/ORC1-like ATPase lid domain-containing protein n=1 Tax=Enterospora canceri TaxID=1081671 RepID=A0A1Y1S4T3_9MICR|nr:hypothetical protein ECANGB1_2292 [Enterospora canceri]